MSRPGPEIRLSTEEREILLRWMRNSKTEQRMVERARAILLASSGLSGKEVALKMKTRAARISKWLRRFAQDRIAGLSDNVRSGEKRRKYTSLTEKRILEALDEAPPAGYSRWNGRLLAKHLGDVSKDQVWRMMRQHDLHLERRQSWCVSTDPEFSRKAADVVSLYLNPPQNALVLCVDEKPCIATDRILRESPLLQSTHKARQIRPNWARAQTNKYTRLRKITFNHPTLL